jgi:pilus assembly protein CpaF
MFSQPELAPISRMLAEPGVTDLVVNGHEHASVLVGGRWRGILSGFESEEDLASAAKLLIALGGRQVDRAHPFGNVDLNGRLRVHVLLGSLVNKKTHISIRVHLGRKIALEQLQQIGMITESQLLSLRSIVEKRESFLISGSAGAGKTTFLRAMLDAVAGERIITIEDIAELQLESNDHVALVARDANLEGAGALSLQQLLIEALRMRPDRIVVGEVRSLELLTLLQAANTGHSVAASIHANSISQVHERISSIAISQGVNAQEANSLVAKSIDWLIHISNLDGKRLIEIRRNHE